MNTLLVLLGGWARYLAWWAIALLRWRDPRAPMRPRRAAMLLVGMPLFLAVQAVHAACLLLDEVLFPRHRRMDVGRALFIVGIPRSGTTFVHRALAADGTRYTTLRTWQALFAPSIIQRRFVQGLSAIDRLLGGGARRVLEGLTRRVSGGLDAIHEVGLRAPEEDYLALLPAGGCFIMLFAFPAATELQALGRFDRGLPAMRRRRLARFHRACLQRHLYVEGGGYTLLSKNAAFGSWLAALHEQCPRARFLVCVREPVSAFRSQVRALAPAGALFATAVDSRELQRVLLEGVAGTLEHLATTLQEWPEDRAAVIELDDLRVAPAQVLRDGLVRVGMPPEAALSAVLQSLPARTQAGGSQSVEAVAIPRETLAEHLEPPYQRLLSQPHRVRIAP